jgi:hypothetical protein
MDDNETVKKAQRIARSVGLKAYRLWNNKTGPNNHVLYCVADGAGIVAGQKYDLTPRRRWPTAQSSQ